MWESFHVNFSFYNFNISGFYAPRESPSLPPITFSPPLPGNIKTLLLSSSASFDASLFSRKTLSCKLFDFVLLNNRKRFGNDYFEGLSENLKHIPVSFSLSSVYACQSSLKWDGITLPSNIIAEPF